MPSGERVDPGTGKRYPHFSSVNPPIEVDVSPDLSADDREALVKRAEAMVPIWRQRHLAKHWPSIFKSRDSKDDKSS